MDKVILERVHGFKCAHNKFKVDTELDYVECGICGEHLNPMFVLSQLCGREARANKHYDYLVDIAEKTANKLRCKCEHCQRMTKIHR